MSTTKAAFTENIKAVTRDYVVKPRLGVLSIHLFTLCIDYRTVVGVNGPLVILDNVKVM